MTWLIVAGWVVCGVLVYGIAKNDLRQMYYGRKYPRYGRRDEGFLYYISSWGPIGLIAIIFIMWIDGSKFGLCFRMPKELCESEQLEEKEILGAAKNLRKLREEGLPPDIKKEIDDHRHPG